MAQTHSLRARPPLATRLTPNTMQSGAASRVAKHACAREEHQDPYAYQHDQEQIIKALENASRLIDCDWSNCYASLGSWELLRKHVEKMHCETLSPAVLAKASSSRPYRCLYASCKVHIFSEPSLLLQHIVMSHLEPLKLRCPFACKQSVSKLQTLVQHLASVHGKTPDKLLGAQIRLPSPRRVPLPDLPINAPMDLGCAPRVAPHPLFDPSRPRALATTSASSSKDEWEDFEDLEDSEEPSGPYMKLKLPKDVRVVEEMRAIPRGRFVVYDGVQSETRSLEPEKRVEGSTMGFKCWKRRFEEEGVVGEVGAGEMAVARNAPNQKKRRKS